MKRARGLYALALLASPLLAVPLDDTERQWVAEHPVVHYAINPNWPLEYVRAGEHEGLTRAYLDRIAAATGLRFELRPSGSWNETVRRLRSGDLDLATAVSVRLTGDRVLNQLLLTDPFFVGSTVIIAREDAPLMFSPRKLCGKTVAVRRSGGYEQLLKALCPTITVLPFDRAEQALDAVAEDDAYAVVGLDLVLQPAMRRNFPERLRVAGALADMPVVLSMGVDPANPVLLRILDKALAGLSTADRNDIEARWVDSTDLGRPSLLAIVRDRWREAGALLLLVVLLAWMARRARAAQRVAQASEKATASFLAVMSHEIRTPMNAVQASLELIQRTPLDAAQHNLLSLANDSSSALLELLDDVLDIARLEARRLTLNPQPTDVRRLLESVVDIHRLAAHSKAVNLTLDSQGLGEQRELMVDPVRLRQVLSNLLSNAVKFTEHGSIVLSAQVLPGPQLAVSVSDSGIGIEPEHQQVLFRAFSQVRQASTREYGGSGLGLAICKQLLVLMGGDIQLDSVPGRGSVFSFSVPVQLATGQVTLPPASEIADTPCSAGATLLVIEDHPVNRQALALQLDALGYAYMMAEDGPQGLALLQANPHCAALLLDCYLPGMDGYEVARQIRALERQSAARRLPIIAISAATDERHRKRALEAGMDALLCKPLRLAPLAEQLHHWLPAQASPATPALPAHLQAVFGKTCRDDILALEAALARGEYDVARHHAHRIHGAALMLKVSAVGAVAQQVEALLSRTPPVPPSVEQLKALRAALVRAMASQPEPEQAGRQGEQ